MTEKEIELYGNRGEIDTEYEKSVIEYRPKVKYEPDRPISVSFPVEVITSDPEEEDVDGGYTPIEKPAQQYDRFVYIWNLIEELIDYSKEEIKDLKIPISPLDLQKLRQSFPSLDFSALQNGFISFDEYDKTFEDQEVPGNVLIQEIVHNYASNIEGNLELELYEDLKETQQTLKEGYFLFKESVLKHYMTDPSPELPEKNEVFLTQIDESVKSQKEASEQIHQNYVKQEELYYDSLRKEYGTPEFFQISDSYLESKRPYDLSIREQKTLLEMMSLVDEVLLGAEGCAQHVKSGLVEGSDIVSEEVMTVLENQASSKDELATILKMSQLSLKLQVNKQLEDKKQYRDVLNNINNLSRKKRAHDELLMALELRNNMYLKTYDTLQNLKSPSKQPSVESFLNQVAGGLELVQSQYDNFLKDTYIMHVSEYEVRKEKVSKALEKENARQGYLLLLEHL